MFPKEIWWKRIVLVALVIGALLLVAAPTLAAGEMNVPSPGGQHGYGTGWIDEDGDGVCDNCPCDGTGWIDEDGDGVCDNCPCDGNHLRYGYGTSRYAHRSTYRQGR